MVTKGKFWQEEHFEGLKSTLNERMHWWNQSYTGRINPNSNLLPPLELFHYGSLHMHEQSSPWLQVPLEISRVCVYLSLSLYIYGAATIQSFTNLLILQCCCWWRYSLDDPETKVHI